MVRAQLPVKLEPNPGSRTTEGGGPRRQTFDASGLEALSMNAASKVHHLPEQFRSDARPAFLAWLRSKGLPRTAPRTAARSNSSQTARATANGRSSESP
eukprot:6190641-Pleurochrysis_carterae.AAC.4